MDQIENLKPYEFRALVREGEWGERTTNIFTQYAQFNLVALPKEYAFDFLLFCHRNPQACPVVDVTDIGESIPKLVAKDADLRTDLPKYRVFQDGKMIEEVSDIKKYWNKDMVGFLLGAAMGFMNILKNNKITFKDYGGYKTSIKCQSAGIFKSNMIVTATSFSCSGDAIRAIQVSSRFPTMHGAPVHIGTPSVIGIEDLSRPYTFMPKEKINLPKDEEVLLYWGCGVTAELAAIESKVPFMITHSPGCFFVSDKLVEEYSVI